MELVKQKDYTLKRATAIAVLFIGAAAARIFWISQVRAQWGGESFYTWLNSSPTSLIPSLVAWIARLFAPLGLTGAGALELSSVLTYVLFGGLLVAPVYGIARRMGGEAIAAGAGLATVFYPAMLASLPQASTMVEPMYLLLVATGWYFLLVGVDKTVLWPAAIGGVFVGLAYLTRPEALVYLAIALGLLLVATWLSRQHSFALRRAAANLGIALAMFALIVGLYLMVLLQVKL